MSMTIDEGRVMDQMPGLREAERERLLYRWNTTQAYPRELCIHQRFEQQVQRSPDAIALEYEGQRMSYRKLNALANQLARRLRQLGVAPDDSVPEDAEAQAVLCFENIKAILAEAGMTLDDVVRFTAYVTDRAYFPVYGAVRSRYVSGNAFASTLVIVSGFTRPEFKVEVEVTAVRAD